MAQFQTAINLIVYNGEPWLPWCLESIANQTYQNFFLLIIDNGSIDGSYDVCSQFLSANPGLAAQARLVKNKHNIGFARGHNQALAWTDSEFVLILNQDVYLLPDYLELLISSLTNLDRAAAVSGKLLTWQFNPATWHASELSKSPVSYFDSMGLRIKRNRRVINIDQGEIDVGQYHESIRVFGVTGTAPLYRREALLAIAPTGEIFDEDFVSYKEDVDLAWRLQLAGYEAWIQPKAVAYHDRSLVVGKSLTQEYSQRQGRARDLKVYSWVNHLAVLVKNDGLMNFCKDLPWWLAHEMIKAFFLLFTDPLTLFKAKLRFLKLLPKFVKKRGTLKSTHRLSYRELRGWWSKTKVSGQKI